MRILNLFAGIGGNRTLWGDKHQITAVEYDPNIVKMYEERFPYDEMIIADAYEFCEDHYTEYDFIWASPPCQTHNKSMYRPNVKKRMPDFKLYEMIFFLQQWCECKWIVENVEVIDEVIRHNSQVGRHLIWCNFLIPNKKFPKSYKTKTYIGSDGKKHNGGLADLSLAELIKLHKINIKISHPLKRSILRNCVDYRIGKYILDQVKNKQIQQTLI